MFFLFLDLLVGSLVCTWNFTMSWPGWNDVDFVQLVKMISSLLTLVLMSASSFVAKAIAPASTARTNVVFLVLGDRSAFSKMMMTTFGPDILSFL